MQATTSHNDLTGFSRIYFKLRQTENRTYTDAEVAVLPGIDPAHPMKKEWDIRKKSCDKLISWFRNKKKALQVLEVGCGNGWLCHQLVSLPGVQATGIDINQEELQQAKRVFAGNDRLRFVYGDIKSAVLPGQRFDAIVLAACIQYFPSVSQLMRELMDLLTSSGEIHIIDSPFYRTGEAGNARERTQNYYRQIGFPEMSQYYFHHETAVLSGLNHRFLYQPSFVQSFILHNKNPFPWIIVTNEKGNA